MQHKIRSLTSPIVVGIIALALGWIAHAGLPLSAEGTVVEGYSILSEPAAPAGTGVQFTYQGRLTTSSGAPVNTPVSMIFKIYDDSDSVLWTSATRTITPSNGLFTVYLGQNPDPDLSQYTLAQPAAIGVKVENNPEMLPHQPLNTVIGHGAGAGQPGVYGSSQTESGVMGASMHGTGVYGVSFLGTGVWGHSSSTAGMLGSSDYGPGVVGISGEDSAPALRAIGNSPSGTALEIYSGTIKVTGAGIGSSTPVFIHQVHTTGGNRNDCFVHNYATVIDHPLINGKVGAILIVTPNYGPDISGVAPAVGIPAVYYDADNQCQRGAGRWVIYNLNSVQQVDNSMFNVLVVTP